MLLVFGSFVDTFAVVKAFIIVNKLIFKQHCTKLSQTCLFHPDWLHSTRQLLMALLWDTHPCICYVQTGLL